MFDYEAYAREANELAREHLNYIIGATSPGASATAALRTTRRFVAEYEEKLAAIKERYGFDVPAA